VERRVARLRQYLIDASPEHHIAAQENPQPLLW
jgi:hypothetical protein